MERPLLAHKMLLGLRIRSGSAGRDKACQMGREAGGDWWKAVLLLSAQFMMRSESREWETMKLLSRKDH